MNETKDWEARIKGGRLRQKKKINVKDERKSRKILEKGREEWKKTEKWLETKQRIGKKKKYMEDKDKKRK